jgi:hypothetical protein
MNKGSQRNRFAGPADTSICGRCRSRQKDETISRAKCPKCGLVYFGCIYCMTAPALVRDHLRLSKICGGQASPPVF